MRGGLTALHAGATVCAGRAVCFVGAKHAGKSTSVINVITHGLGDFMANDKVLVFEEGGDFWARGLPVSAGLRLGTLRLFESLLPALDQRLDLHCENWKVEARPPRRQWHAALCAPAIVGQIARLRYCGAGPARRYHLSAVPARIAQSAARCSVVE